MHPVEWQCRALLAAFYAQPAFAQWARRRARELATTEAVTVVVRWGGRCFSADDVPGDDPEFCVRRADGTLERAPWAGKESE